MATDGWYREAIEARRKACRERFGKLREETAPRPKVEVDRIATESTEKRKADLHELIRTGVGMPSPDPVTPHVSGPTPVATTPTKLLPAPVEPYSFPELLPGGKSHLSDDQLLNILRKSVEITQRQTTHFRDAAKFRTIYSTVAFEMNRRGLIAPNFRPRLPAPPLTERTQLDNDHVRDLVIIDLHWWACRGRDVSHFGYPLQPVFHFGTFDLEEAVKFACLPWPSIRKAQAAKLTKREQWQMAKLRDKALAREMQKFQKDSAKLAAALSEEGEGHSAIRAALPDWQNLRLAAAIARSVGSAKSAQVTRDITKFYNLIAGKMIKRQSVANKLHRLMQRLTRARAEWLIP